ncbi:acyl carrier protein [Catenulispora sp. GAS73]|uniref:acyl carrier protein n=1 Tax=Catenulispora sp. GAS73 TaxID=3156269 RepID=UPI003511473A
MKDNGSGQDDHGDHGDHGDSARGPLRAQVRARWADALDHDRFTDDDDFFEVGGHSLLIADIMAGLGAQLGRRLSLRLFFDHPTVNELTDALAEAGAVVGTPAR